MIPKSPLYSTLVTVMLDAVRIYTRQYSIQNWLQWVYVEFITDAFIYRRKYLTLYIPWLPNTYIINHESTQNVSNLFSAGTLLGLVCIFYQRHACTRHQLSKYGCNEMFNNWTIPSCIFWFYHNTVFCQMFTEDTTSAVSWVCDMGCIF